MGSGREQPHKGTFSMGDSSTVVAPWLRPQTKAGLRGPGRCEGPANPGSPPKTPPKGWRVALDRRLGLAFSCRRRPGSRSSGQPDCERACAAKLPCDERPGRGAGPTNAHPDPSPLRVQPRPGRGEPSARLLGGDSQLPPLFSLLSRTTCSPGRASSCPSQLPVGSCRKMS